ncbi:MAG: GTP cyclohydrolase II [Chloroflexota bacterium]
MAIAPLTVDELLGEGRDHRCRGYGADEICVRVAAVADLPTRFGLFQVVAFWNDRDGKEHAAFVKGDPTDAEGVPVRLHSECLTGDAIGSLRCDCRDQLEAALAFLGSQETGLLLYLRQEGRGIGFLNKIRTYGLQDHGYDTVEANVALGFRDDERDYAVGAHMLDTLRVHSIRLCTNNPRKVDDLARHGVEVVERVPLEVEPNEYNRFYLATKAIKSGHLYSPDGKRRLLEQDDRPLVRGMSPEQRAALLAEQEGAEQEIAGRQLAG